MYSVFEFEGIIKFADSLQRFSTHKFFNIKMCNAAILTNITPHRSSMQFKTVGCAAETKARRWTRWTICSREFTINQLHHAAPKDSKRSPTVPRCEMINGTVVDMLSGHGEKNIKRCGNSSKYKSSERKKCGRRSIIIIAR